MQEGRLIRQDIMRTAIAIGEKGWKIYDLFNLKITINNKLTITK